MSEDRMTMYEGFVANEPDNTLAWYVLAQERAKRGLWAEARAAYERVLHLDPGYLAAYYHGAVALRDAGEVAEARAWLARGVEAARAKGDDKTLAEMQELLASLEG